MRDGFIFRSLPLFSGTLAFLPGCSGPSSSDNTGGSDGGTMTTSTETTSTTGVDDSGTSAATTVATTMTTSIDTGTETGTETGDPECGPAAHCGTAAPAGWFGPLVYAKLDEGQEPTPCPDPFSNAGPTLLEGFNDPGPAICGCECQLSGGSACQGNIRAYNDNLCTNYNFYYNLQVTAMCTNDALPPHWKLQVYQGYPPPSCMKNDSEDIPTLHWDATIRTCRLATPLSCTDGVCTPDVPPGFEAQWCIYQDGDVECPPGDFTEKTTMWTGADDTRQCSNCTCGSAQASCNSATVQVFAGADCAGDPVVEVGLNQCSSQAGGSFAGNFGEGGGCPVTADSMPMGEVGPIGPFTFCCHS